MKFLALLAEVPSSLWGVVVGGILTLSGVFLTNRATNRRLHQQLEHDRLLKQKERDLSLRKEIYLAAAETIAEGLNSLIRFADLRIPHDKLSERYIEKSASIAKVHVVASEPTARALLTFLSELSAAFLRLYAKRYPLSSEYESLAVLDEQIKTFAKERDRWLEEMKQFNLEGVPDARKWEVIQGNFEFERGRIAQTIQERATRRVQLGQRQLEYMQDCLAELKRVAPLLLPAVVGIRHELELTIDEEAYAQLMEESLRQQEVSISEFLKSIASTGSA